MDAISHPLIVKALEKLDYLGKGDNETYLNRIEIEALEIEKQGLWDYFSNLLSQDAKYPNENNLLLAYLLGICEEDPLSFDPPKDLLWVQSNDFPDIDTDFLPNDRDKIKAWISERFGVDRVCSICNYATYKTKSALKDVSRVFEVPVSEVNDLTTKMDDDVNKIPWDVAIERYPQLAKFEKKYPEVCAVVRRLRGRHFRLGKHAAGVVISDRPLTDIVPLVQRDGNVMSAWAEGQATSDLKTVGLVKFDLLGLDNLEYIKRTQELISEIWRDIKFKNGGSVRLEIFNKIGGLEVGKLKIGDRIRLGEAVSEVSSIEPVRVDFRNDDYLNDEKSLKMADRGDLVGVFQFDSKGIRELTKQIGVKEFEDLVSATCLFRPGPLDSGMAKSFIRRRREEETYELHDILKPIMGKTEGIALYQEQTMQIFNKVGGISLPNCEKIRKAMGQKKVSEFLKFKDEFLETGSKRLGWIKTKAEAVKRGADPNETVESFWDKIEKSSGYLFNRSHGVVYTMVSMQCLYLKAHFPREYFASVLSCLDTSDGRRAIYMREARRLGVEFVPVDINRSKLGFTIGEDGKVYFGFDKIKGVGNQAEKVVEHQPYTSFNDFLNKFGLGKKVCEPLIKLGAFDEFHKNRKALHEVYLAHYKQKARKTKRTVCLGGGEALRSYKELLERQLSGDKISRDEINNTPIVIDPDQEPFSLKEICDFEDLYYGLFFNHPLTARHRTGLTIEDVAKNGKVEVYISGIKQKKTKNGKPYYILFTEDETGSLRVILWEDQYKSCSEIVKPGNCVELNVVPPERFPSANLVKGTLPKLLRCIGEPAPEELERKRLDEEFVSELQDIIRMV